MLGALELDVLDGEAAPFGGGRRWRLLGAWSWQLLEILQTLLLLFEQTILPIADQIGITRRGGDHLGMNASEAKQ